MAFPAGLVTFLAVVYLKRWLGYDDALDTFGIHGVGGTIGAILTGIFADASVNSAVADLKEGLIFNQIKASVLTIVLAVVATAVIALIVKVLIGLRPTPEEEHEGLDTVDHDEEGYLLEH